MLESDARCDRACARTHTLYDPSNTREILIYGRNKPAGGLDKHRARAYSVHKSTTERSRVRHKLSCSRGARVIACQCSRGRGRGNARFSNPRCIYARIALVRRSNKPGIKLTARDGRERKGQVALPYHFYICIL